MKVGRRLMSPMPRVPFSRNRRNDCVTVVPRQRIADVIYYRASVYYCYVRRVSSDPIVFVSSMPLRLARVTSSVCSLWTDK